MNQGFKKMISSLFTDNRLLNIYQRAVVCDQPLYLFLVSCVISFPWNPREAGIRDHFDLCLENL